MVSQITLPYSLNLESIQATLNAITAAIADEATSLLILEGTSEHFCIGMSFDYLTNHTTQDIHQSIDLFVHLMKVLYLSQKPTIALVQGKALAGGVGLAAACDIIIADENASFGFSETLFGLLPGIILPFLLQRVSSQKLKSLFLAAGSVGATHALRLGLVDVIARTSEIDNCLHDWIKKLSRLDPEVVHKTKALIADAHSLSLDANLQKGSALLKEGLETQTTRDKILNFTEFGIAPWERMSA